jgi:hypothetical protein
MNRRHLAPLILVPANRAIREMEKSFATEQTEYMKNKRALRATQKYLDILEWCQELIISTALVLNAYLFAWWIRGMKPAPKCSPTASQAYLYSIGVALFFPNICIAILNTCEDLSLRYDIERYLTIHNYLVVGISLWAVLLLIVSAFKLSRVLEGADNSARKPIHIAWRLLASQFAIGILVQIAVALIGIPLFELILKFQK